ncbi:MAG: VWA domain-containing protein, partial [Gemmatimonadetes bacterium]|nr:VWA domain-containing protein [Gemmatimonadota bacterium]
MHFLNPAALVGLVAALIPLAIHLLHRGRTRPLPFSNLHFLRRLHHSRMRRVRLRQWLVLLLRTLIIALIICAFARPTYQAGSGWGGRSVPAAAVLLLDLSYSTGFRLAGGSLFAQLQRQALELLGLFERRDQVAVIPFASRPHSPEERGEDFERLEERLRELAPGEEATELKSALQAGARHLAERLEMDRELFLLTDLAHYNWDALEELRFLPLDVRVYISEPTAFERGNIHIDEVRSPSWMPAVGQKLPLRVLLTNSSKQAVTGSSLDLFLDGERVHHRDVDLRPGEEVRVELTVTPRRSGRLTGHVELEEDGLPLDNRRYFAIDVPERIQVLLLGERPADTYYPRRALGAAGSADPVLAVRSGLFAELDSERLEGVDVLVLCNLQRLNGAQTGAIHDFVAAGGGLILIPGPLADLNFFN